MIIEATPALLCLKSTTPKAVSEIKVTAECPAAMKVKHNIRNLPIVMRMVL